MERYHYEKEYAVAEPALLKPRLCLARVGNKCFPRARLGVPLPPVVGFCVQTLITESCRKELKMTAERSQRRKEMTGLQTALNFNDFDKLFVGFDRLHNQLASRVTDLPITNYPRYNLVAIGEEAYRIELALPGWKKQDIEIKQHKNELSIEGKEKQELDSNEERYIYKGLSGKTFKRVFTLGDWVEVKDAGFKDGLLVVNLEVDVPEAEKPKAIEIG